MAESQGHTISYAEMFAREMVAAWIFVTQAPDAPANRTPRDLATLATRSTNNIELQCGRAIRDNPQCNKLPKLTKWTLGSEIVTKRPRITATASRATLHKRSLRTPMPTRLTRTSSKPDSPGTREGRIIEVLCLQTVRRTTRAKAECVRHKIGASGWRRYDLKTVLPLVDSHDHSGQSRKRSAT